MSHSLGYTIDGHTEERRKQKQNNEETSQNVIGKKRRGCPEFRHVKDRKNRQAGQEAFRQEEIEGKQV